MFTHYDPEAAALTVRLRDQFEAFLTGRWDAAELAAHQTGRLREVVAYARANSPFYRRHLAALGDEEAAGLRIEDLSRLPFTTKDHLRKAQFDMLSRPVWEAWTFYETTGTTGVATPCPRTNADTIHNNTALTAYYRDVLAPYGDRQVIGISGPSELHSTGDTFGDVCRNLGHTVAKMWPHSPVIGFDRALEVMRLLPVTGLFCTPGMAMRLAQKATEAGLRPREDFSLDVLMLTGELMSPSLLENIGTLWGAEVHNALYASQEASVLAAAVSDGSLRTAPLINHYEVIDPDTLEPVAPDRAGVRYGELVVTNLYAGAKPLVRYRTGDLVRMTEPGPGAAVPAPAVQAVGRTRDRLSLNGRLVNGYDLEDLLLRSFRGYLDYQISVDRDDAGQDRLSLTLQTDPAAVHAGLERAVGACLDTLDTPLTVQTGTPGAITSTGAMVSWKAARVVDVRTGRSQENGAAERIAATRK
ncbi:MULTISPECIES: phenylacetate--CoA ligase family protein [unclassified Streptomyces]|uniref:phenylacetate--CoA ligase family protein n=1 Tax=unclassified Streptomyces TaxID=2593676 RepID=UPI001F03FC7E|nr:MULTISPECIES: phenylacetate--CoA ligase family protein [unclassified Streptomyces]MCH0564861.1 phenylacetate--CoA ligase family protein [Streptomyces sp. MUM 2J]MCH0569865.1 phenylacetate--CoA ligase family protein [Streptomyces sp. MUM 136J]